MDKGELILSDYYKRMKVNRPIPWIGMPVFYKNQWHFVKTVNASGCAKLDRSYSYDVLTSYIDESPELPLDEYRQGHKCFCLPGEPNAPPMCAEFCKRLAYAYTWGKRFEYRNDRWVDRKGSLYAKDRHTYLLTPYGADLNILFPNNGVVVKIATSLKKQNTDGRTECAQCNKPLMSLWIGNTNLSYCPECEK